MTFAFAIRTQSQWSVMLILAISFHFHNWRRSGRASSRRICFHIYFFRSVSFLGECSEWLLCAHFSGAFAKWVLRRCSIDSSTLFNMFFLNRIVVSYSWRFNQPLSQVPIRTYSQSTRSPGTPTDAVERAGTCRHLRIRPLEGDVFPCQVAGFWRSKLMLLYALMRNVLKLHSLNMFWLPSNEWLNDHPRMPKSLWRSCFATVWDQLSELM